MTRYFYTDALEAAYMAKHYGIDFEVWRWEGSEYNMTLKHDRKKQRNGVTMSVAGRILQNRGASRFYIHPDSVHLLEPQIGDLMRGTNNRVAMYFTGDTSPKSTAHIVQRNGEPFFWPEAE